MRSFMEEWQTAKLSPDARTKILAEAMKLFGGGMRGTRRESTLRRKASSASPRRRSATPSHPSAARVRSPGPRRMLASGSTFTEFAAIPGNVALSIRDRPIGFPERKCGSVLGGSNWGRRVDVPGRTNYGTLTSEVRTAGSGGARNPSGARSPGGSNRGNSGVGNPAASGSAPARYFWTDAVATRYATAASPGVRGTVWGKPLSSGSPSIFGNTGGLTGSAARRRGSTAIGSPGNVRLARSSATQRTTSARQPLERPGRRSAEQTTNSEPTAHSESQGTNDAYTRIPTVTSMSMATLAWLLPRQLRFTPAVYGTI